MSAFLLCFKVLVQYGERWKVLVLGDTFPSVVKKEFDIDSEVTILFLALQWKPCEVGKAISFLSFIYQNPTLMEKVNLGAGIWHSVGAWGWGIWLWLPWKCQIPLDLPTLGLNIDRCIKCENNSEVAERFEKLRDGSSLNQVHSSTHVLQNALRCSSAHKKLLCDVYSVQCVPSALLMLTIQ